MKNTPELIQKRKELAAKYPKMSHVIQSQSLTDLDEYGHRMKKVKLYKPKTWIRYPEIGIPPIKNFRAAVVEAINKAKLAGS